MSGLVTLKRRPVRVNAGRDSTLIEDMVMIPVPVRALGGRAFPLRSGHADGGLHPTRVQAAGFRDEGLDDGGLEFLGGEGRV
jgi:hypothetical protein